MAKIVFYESTKIDTFQLQEAFRDTDHELVFMDDVITPENAVIDADVLSVFVDSNVNSDVLEKIPNLKLIATRSTGFNHIDLDAAQEHNISVVNVPTYGENTVAEHAFALLLALSRKLLTTLDSVAHGSYASDEHIGFDLKGKTLGLIGAGRIGQQAARIGRGFQMNVIAYDTYENEAIANEIGFSYKSFDDVLRESDVLSIHAPLTAEDYHLINEGTIEHMKRGAILINTARGELVENRALIAALRSGHIAAAGLDTLDGEQFLHQESIVAAINGHATSPDDYTRIAEVEALSKMNNVLITPHSAFNTAEAIQRINNTTAENIHGFFAGELQNKVEGSNRLGKLIVVRHGESEYNLEGRWTGTTDVHLAPQGIEKAAKLGEKLKDMTIDYTYTSQQIRTKETLEAIMNGSGHYDLHHEPALALNERDYGIYTGMNKDQIKAIIGEESFMDLRRSWDSPVEGGESLKDVYQRVIPFYLRVVMPRIRHGQNVMLVAHGNSIRSLIKYIDDIADEDIGSVEMNQKSVHIYDVDMDGRSKKKEVRSIDD